MLSSGIVSESPRLWALRYRTRLRSEDRAALDAEALQLWAEVQADAEASGATRASLWPTNLDSHTIHLDGWRPVLYTRYSLDFQFEKDASGAWKHVLHLGRIEQPLVW